MPLPLAVHRPSLLIRGALANRDRPNLGKLQRVADAERFCWAVLPHAARSFYTSIVLLPPIEARTAAIGYLYARMLDTYEDLSTPVAHARSAMGSFATRFRTTPPAPPSPIDSLARDERDRVHLLLLERYGLVDEVYAQVPPEHQVAVVDMVTKMAVGMSSASEMFERQAGVLQSEAQLLRYCRVVIGQPALFVLNLMTRRELSTREVDLAMGVSEFVQLANITRDVETDLARGVAYHPSLAPFVGAIPSAASESAVRTARLAWIRLALGRVSAFRELLEEVGTDTVSKRASALMLLSFTEWHYRQQAHALGLPTGGGPETKAGLLFWTLQAALSADRTNRAILRLEENLTRTARAVPTAA